jgi:intergrase/recombinase
MKQDLTYAEIKQGRNALSMLGSLPQVPESYPIAKNLKRFNRAIKDVDEIASELYLKAVEKDEEGNPRMFDKAVTDKDGETKETRITDKKLLKDYADQMEKLNKDKHEIDIHQVPYDRFKKYVDEKGIDSNILAPLLDVFIIDGEVTEGKPNAK